jgi:hypothetical protein
MVLAVWTLYLQIEFLYSFSLSGESFFQWQIPSSAHDFALASFLTLIGVGEVKVDLADFDLKLQENLLSTLYFFLPVPAKTSSRSFLTHDMTSKNDILTSILISFCQKSGRGVPCQTPPSARFYCYYRSPEAGRSPAEQWSAVRCGASQEFQSVSVHGLRIVRGRQVLCRACSLAHSNWTAGAAPVWGISRNRRPL